MKKARRALGPTLGATACVVLGGAARGQMTDEELRNRVMEERISTLESKFNSPDNLRVQWRDGLRLTSPDNRFDLKIGGRIHFESEWNEADNPLEASRRYAGDSGQLTNSSGASTLAAIGPLEDGMQLRRARLYLSGTIHQHFEFKWQYDFAKGAVGHRDAYGGAINLGDWIPNIRAGHMYEPFGLDAITSSNDSTFIERSSISLSFAPNRNPGFLLWKNWKDANNEERITWALGTFREDSSDNSVSQADGAWAVTGRVTGTPYWKDAGKRMLHLGLAVTERAVGGRGTEGVTYSAKPESDLLNIFLSTGAMREADIDRRYAAEAAFIWRRWSLQGEYMRTRTEMNKASTLHDASFAGWYVQAAWTITGENRRWKPAEAIFSNPKPFANAFENGGMGAWEAAVRLSELDLTDGTKGAGGVQGGSMGILTFGLNWYLNPNVRLMWDVSRADLNVDDAALGAGGDATILQMRVQFAF